MGRGSLQLTMLALPVSHAAQAPALRMHVLLLPAGTCAVPCSLLTLNVLICPAPMCHCPTHCPHTHTHTITFRSAMARLW